MSPFFLRSAVAVALLLCAATPAAGFRISKRAAASAGAWPAANASAAERGEEYVDETDLTPIIIPPVLRQESTMEATSKGFNLEELKAYIDFIEVVGQKIWAIVEEGKPVSEIKTKSVDVYPQNLGWQDMANWRHSTTAAITVVNTKHAVFGHQAVKLDITPSCFYGGNYQGRGMFLKDCKLRPSYAYVDWLHNLEVDVIATEPHNIGTIESPIAEVSLTADIKWWTVVQSWSRRAKFIFSGDGGLQVFYS